MTPHIYVVMGSHGEYSDRGEWPVAAYCDEKLAQEHVTRVEQAAREWESIGNTARKQRVNDVGELATTLDPKKPFELWGSDTRRYWLETIAVYSEVPT